MTLLTNTLTVSSRLSRKYSARSTRSPAEHCVNLVKQYDHENFLCTLLLPGKIRRAAFCIRAFNIEVSLIGDKTKEESIGLMRYKWWNEALSSVYSDKPLKHPVVLELNKVIKENNLFRKQFTRLLTARSQFIPKSGFKSTNVMEAYAEESTSPVYYLILQAAGLTNVNADHAASHLGKAQGIVNLIRSVPHHTSRRQCVMPQDILVKHGIPEEVFMSTRDESSKGIRDVIFDVASIAQIHVEKARKLIDDVPKEVKPIFLPAVAVRNYLERLRDIDFDVFDVSAQERNTNLGLQLFWAKLIRRY